MSTPSPKEIAFEDLDREIAITRRVLEALPPEHYAWSPHEKSMSLQRLALHVADLPAWVTAALAGDELDAANAPRSPGALKSREELLARFDANVERMRQAVEQFDMAAWQSPWTMRSGDKIIVTRPRWMVCRVWSVNHMIHHRAQLCLYLRLLNVKVPTVYFNTADDASFVFE